MFSMDWKSFISSQNILYEILQNSYVIRHNVKHAQAVAMAYSARETVSMSVDLGGT